MSDKMANVNIPKVGESWVMECTFEVERTCGEITERVVFSGYAVSEVVETFLEIAKLVIA